MLSRGEISHGPQGSSKNHCIFCYSVLVALIFFVSFVVVLGLHSLHALTSERVRGTSRIILYSVTVALCTVIPSAALRYVIAHPNVWSLMLTLKLVVMTFLLLCIALEFGKQIVEEMHEKSKPRSNRPP